MNLVQQIKELSEMKGRGTSMISYYISEGTDISSVSTCIVKEMSASNNIKSKAVRKDVQSGLRSIQQYLKGIKHIPNDGLAMFAGTESLV